MSLSRSEWTIMWSSITTIESLNMNMQPRSKVLRIQKEIDKIKNQIKQVIEQMNNE